MLRVFRRSKSTARFCNKDTTPKQGLRSQGGKKKKRENSGLFLGMGCSYTGLHLLRWGSCDVWLALLGLKILVQELIQSWLLWWGGQGSFTDLSKSMLQEGRTAGSKEKGRGSKTFLLISFDKLYVCPWDIGPGTGNATGIKIHVCSPPCSPWKLFTNQEDKH